jgi:hypothetical protein
MEILSCQKYLRESHPVSVSDDVVLMLGLKYECCENIQVYTVMVPTM